MKAIASLRLPLSRGLFALSLAMCAGASLAAPPTFTVTEREDDQQTLGDLKPAFIDFTSKAIPNIPADEVIRRYVALIKAADDPELRVRALHRLANLEALFAEQKPEGLLDDQLWELAVESYNAILKRNPGRKDADELYYQLAHAYDMKGDPQHSLENLDILVGRYPQSKYALESKFRIAELQYSAGRYPQAENAYAQVVAAGKTTPYYAKAQYMLGWSMFQEDRRDPALKQFMTVLDSFQTKKEAEMDKIEIDLREDTLRIMSVMFAESGGATEMDRLIQRTERDQYADLLYSRLSDHYMQKRRFEDAAETSASFIRRYPNNPKAPLYAVRRVEAYQAGNFPSQIWPEKERFVTQFGIYSTFWASQTQESREAIEPYLKQYLDELSRQHYANGQKVKGEEARAEYLAAAGYFRHFVEAFPADEASGEKYFLMAEALYSAGEYARAIPAYERAAYDYQTFARRAESGYAALVAYEKAISQLPPEKQEDWRNHRITSLVKFTNQFPDDSHVPALLVLAANEQLSFKRYQAAMTSAQGVTTSQRKVDSDILRGAWLAEGEAAFELLQYAQAEYAFQEALKRWKGEPEKRKEVEEKLAASIYQQGEMALAQNRSEDAIDHFLRVGTVVPGSEIRANAQYDAAMKLMESYQWDRAIKVLSDFRKDFPTNPLAAGVAEKLVYAYQQNHQPAKAASELLVIAKQDPDADRRRKAQLQGANMLAESGQQKAATKAYEDYVKQYPRPIDDAADVEAKLAAMAAKRGDHAEERAWLEALIVLDQSAGEARNDRTRYLAADSSWKIAQVEKQNFDDVALSLPLKQSLAKKRSAMEKVLERLKRTNDYGVAEFATAATYLSGEVYRQLSKDILSSERPRNLNEMELEQYGLLLEEQAFPFEEKAIQFYEVNTHRARDGIYDKWVQESYGALRKMVPARYDKQEKRVDVVSNLQ